MRDYEKLYKELIPLCRVYCDIMDSNDNYKRHFNEYVDKTLFKVGNSDITSFEGFKRIQDFNSTDGTILNVYKENNMYYILFNNDTIYYTYDFITFYKKTDQKRFVRSKNKKYVDSTYSQFYPSQNTMLDAIVAFKRADILGLVDDVFHESITWRYFSNRRNELLDLCNEDYLFNMDKSVTLDNILYNKYLLNHLTSFSINTTNLPILNVVYENDKIYELLIYHVKNEEGTFVKTMAFIRISSK